MTFKNSREKAYYIDRKFEKAEAASKNALELLRGMLEYNPSRRITVKESLQQKYFLELPAARRPRPARGQSDQGSQLKRKFVSQAEENPDRYYQTKSYKSYDLLPLGAPPHRPFDMT